MKTVKSSKYLLISLSLVVMSACATTEASRTPEENYAIGERSFKRGNYETAIAEWKKVKESFQSPDLTSKAELGIADAYFKNKSYPEAAAAYEDFRKLHPLHQKSEYALYMLSLCHYKQIHGIDTDQTPVTNAVATLESYIRTYPSGEHIQQVKEKLLDCRSKQLQYEIYVGEFYLKTGSYPAAISRFESAFVKFPDSGQHDELLYNLGKAYQKSGERNKAKIFFERLKIEYPTSRYSDKVPRL